jgi:nicotinate-nucleotide adenylyltransferase
MSRRVGILGGMFDPIHRGHTDVAEAAESALQLNQLLLIPANIPPHRSHPVASSFHRFAMVALVVSGRSGWQASDLELVADRPSFTSTTLGHFHELGIEPVDLFFVVGADAFAEIEAWKDYPDILGMANFAVVSRPGHPVSALQEKLPSIARRMVYAGSAAPSHSPSIILIDAQTSDVSSTAIRQRVRGDQPITGLVDAAVEQHIARHELYRSSSSVNSRIDEPRSSAAGRLHAQSRQGH